ncbi:MAG: hypothetical protein ACI9OJ_006062, partial [Myxococcota bacterium]
ERPLLIDLRLPLWRASGELFYPDHPSGPQRFESLFPAELTGRLQQEAAGGGGNRTLVLATYRAGWLVQVPADRIAELFGALHAFKSVVHVVLSRPTPFADDLQVRSVPELDRELRPADASSGGFPWPGVRDEFLLDESHVSFPDAGSLLGASSLADAIADPEVVLVIPFASFYRDTPAWVSMVMDWLPGVPRDRVRFVDYAAPSVRAERQLLIDSLVGHRFVTLGYGKFDVMHYGLDLAFGVWERSLTLGTDFRFEGYGTQLPEAAAVTTRRQLTVTYRVQSSVRRLIWSSVDALQRLTGGLGLALMLFGVLAGLALMPLTLPAARSRARRGRLPVSLRPFEFDEALWMGGGRFRERAGSVAQLLPFAVVAGMTGARAESLGLSGLGLASDTAPLLAAFVAVLALAAGLVERQGRAQHVALWGALIVVFPLTWLLKALPAAPLVFLSGAMLVRVFESVDARLSSRMLPTIDGTADLPRKAGRLLALRASRTPLFLVPPTVVRSTAELSVGLEPEAIEAIASELGHPSRYAVRSAAEVEDAAEASCAGRYATELDVAISDLSAACVRVAQSMEGLPGVVIVQPMIQAARAGVCVTRDGSAPGSGRVEWAEGSSDAVTSGRVVPETAWFGRRTGNAHGADAFLTRVFVSARALEEVFGRPQDVEWIEDAETGVLYVVQSRDIGESSVARGFERALHGRLPLSRGALDARLPAPSRLTADLLEHLHRPGCALDRALSIAGLSPLRRAPICATAGRLLDRPPRIGTVRAALRRASTRRRLRLSSDALIERVLTEMERRPREGTIADQIQWIAEEGHVAAALASLVAELGPTDLVIQASLAERIDRLAVEAGLLVDDAWELAVELPELATKLSPVQVGRGATPLEQLRQGAATAGFREVRAVGARLRSLAEARGVSVAWLTGLEVDELRAFEAGQPARPDPLWAALRDVALADSIGVDDLEACGRPPETSGAVGTWLTPPQAFSGLVVAAEGELHGTSNVLTDRWLRPG